MSFNKKILTFTFSSLLFCSLIIGVLPSFAQIQRSPTGSLSILPSSQSDLNNLQTKSWFVEQIRPGESVERSAKINNPTEIAQDIQINAKDSLQTTDGTFTYKENTEKDTEVGSWITLEKDRVNIPAKSSQEIKFKINVPKETKSGEYAGVVAIQTKPVVSNQESVLIQNRIGVRVYITVPGELNMGTAVNNFEIITPTAKMYDNFVQNNAQFDDLYINLESQNIGNIFSKTFYKINIKGPNGETVRTIDQDLVPNQKSSSIVYTTNEKLKIGKYSLSLDLENRPIITSNKPQEIPEISPKKSYQFQIEITQDILDKMKNDKGDVKKPIILPSDVKGPGLQIRNEENQLPDETNNNSKYDLKIVIISTVLATIFFVIIIGVLAWKLYQRNTTKTTQEKQQDDAIKADKEVENRVEELQTQTKEN